MPLRTREGSPTAIAAELLRQHGYRVRFNDNSQPPQILELVEEVELPKPSRDSNNHNGRPVQQFDERRND